jgi:predicted double-glycine peptidase
MLNVPPIRQTPGFCGPASLSIVLAYFGMEKSESEAAKLMGATREKGVGVEGFLKAAKKLKIKADFKDNASLDDIQRYVITKKIPVIVDWFSTDDGHYSVVVDITSDTIFLQDPELGTIRALDLETFVRVWFDFPGNKISKKSDLILRRMIVIEK